MNQGIKKIPSKGKRFVGVPRKSQVAIPKVVEKTKAIRRGIRKIG